MQGPLKDPMNVEAEPEIEVELIEDPQQYVET